MASEVSFRSGRLARDWTAKLDAQARSGALPIGTCRLQSSGHKDASAKALMEDETRKTPTQVTAVGFEPTPLRIGA